LRWPYGWVGTRLGTVRSEDDAKQCVKSNDPEVEGLLRESAFRIHAKAMTFNFTGSRSHGDEARRLLLAFARSSGFDEVDGVPTCNGANQCALDISIFVPLLIDSAMLLERHRGWRPSDTRALQLWLADVPYKTTSAVGRTRKNNWGTAAAFASWSIARYLIGSGIELEEVYSERRILNASEARGAHLQTQINKMSTTWEGDTRCVVFGIQPHGGIPDELRRGSAGCHGSHIDKKGRAYGYQITAIKHLIHHAKAVRRHMNNELFEYGALDSVPAIHRAIRFVIDNDTGISQEWKPTELGPLRVASHACSDPSICPELAKSNPGYYRESLYLPYTKLTRPNDDCPVDAVSDTVESS